MLASLKHKQHRLATWQITLSLIKKGLTLHTWDPHVRIHDTIPSRKVVKICSNLTGSLYKKQDLAIVPNLIASCIVKAATQQKPWTECTPGYPSKYCFFSMYLICIVISILFLSYSVSGASVFAREKEITHHWKHNRTCKANWRMRPWWP